MVIWLKGVSSVVMAKCAFLVTLVGCIKVVTLVSDKPRYASQSILAEIVSLVRLACGVSLVSADWSNYPGSMWRFLDLLGM